MQPSLPGRVLAIMAHPDDIEFMAGGTVGRWARAGVELHYCLLTDGSSGSRDPLLTPEALAQIRRTEQHAAGKLFNVASYSFMGYPDGRLVNSIELRLNIARVIRRVRPDTVLTSDPLFFYSPQYLNHPDHRAAGEATMAAIMPLANTRLAAPELLAEELEPHDVLHVYLAQASRPTLWVPLTEEDLEQKAAAFSAHTSQLGSWDYKGMMRRFGEQAAVDARANGVETSLAEAFVFVNLDRRQQPPE